MGYLLGFIVCLDNFSKNSKCFIFQIFQDIELCCFTRLNRNYSSCFASLPVTFSMSAEIENAATFSKTRKVFRIKAAFTFLFLSIVKTPKTKKHQIWTFLLQNTVHISKICKHVHNLLAMQGPDFHFVQYIFLNSCLLQFLNQKAHFGIKRLKLHRSSCIYSQTRKNCTSRQGKNLDLFFYVKTIQIDICVTNDK